MKRVFTFFAAISIICGMYAQSLERDPAFKPSIKKAELTRDAADMTIGYCEPDVITNGIGNSQQGNFGAAIRMDMDGVFKVFAGSNIKALDIGFADNVTNVSIFIRSTLTGADLYTQTVGSKAGGWHTIELTTPFTCPETDFYIGYNCTGKYCIGFSGIPNNNACWLFAGGSWSDYSTNGWGSLCIMAVIDGATYTGNDVGIENVSTIYAEAGKEISVKGIAKNLTTTTLTSFNIEYSINDGTSVAAGATCSIEPGLAGNFTFDIPSLLLGFYSIEVTLTDDDDDASNNSAEGTVIVADKYFQKKIVVEEGTGTWCGWCPRGMVGLAYMKENYPDNFIAIGVHNSDAMDFGNYDSSLGFGGYPSSKINRKYELDPNASELEAAYLEEIQIPSIVGIELDATLDVETKIITAVSTVTFGVSMSNANYRIAYVVIENDVTGYNQTNYYEGGGNGEMGGWEKLPGTVPTTFNDVARGIYSAFTGVPSSIPAGVESKVPFEHEYSITLPNTIQDMDQLELVALVINVATGQIENATIIREFLTASEGVIRYTAINDEKGTVTASVDGEDIESGTILEIGTEVAFTAVPVEDYEVKEWMINGEIVSDDARGNTLNVVMDGMTTNISVKFKNVAGYEIIYYVVGENGSLTAEAEESEVSSGSFIPEGTQVTFIAAPTEGYEVKEWTINGVKVNDNITNELVTDMSDDDMMVTVEFKQKVSIDKNTLSGITVYGKGSTVNIVNDSNIALQSVQVIDMTGRTVYVSKAVTSNVININAASGHYVVKVIGEDGKVATTKVYLSK